MPKARKTKQAKTRVLIVDDHPIFRDGLRQLINQKEDLTVCGESDGGPETLEALDKLKPDIILLDLTLKDSNGFELLKDIKTRQCSVRILMLSVHDESLYAERLLRAGADGYIMKSEAPTCVITAIRRVLGGNVFLSEKMSAQLLRSHVGNRAREITSPVQLLSDRELQVFQLLGGGYGTGEIAKHLRLSVSTVETHRANIKRKLNMNNGTELLKRAIQWSQNEPTA